MGIRSAKLIFSIACEEPIAAMARPRKDDSTPTRVGRVLSTPRVFLARIFVTLMLTGFLVSILSPQLSTAFKTNPFLNSMIIGVFVIGSFYVFWQVLRLYPEIRWVNAFRIADPGLVSERQPILLAPMSTMLRERTGALSLSTAAMRSIMDSIASRLDEARDTGKYVVGLLVFLGLLGTFWGLLETMQAVGQTIASLDTKGGEGATAFTELKEGLAAPLRGMGTAFSSSLLGLSGSLVLGFLELQATQAHNRFYNELEEWLSGITELTPGVERQRRSTTRPPDLCRRLRDAALGGRAERAAGGDRAAGHHWRRSVGQGSCFGCQPARHPDAKGADHRSPVGRRAGRPAGRGG